MYIGTSIPSILTVKHLLTVTPLATYHLLHNEQKAMLKKQRNIHCTCTCFSFLLEIPNSYT